MATARTSRSPSYHRSYAFGDVGSTRPSRAGSRGQTPLAGVRGHTPSYGLQGHTPTIDVREYGAYYPIGGRGSSASRYESYSERKSRGRSTTPGQEPVCIRSQSLDRSIGRNPRGVDHTTKRLLDFGHISDPTVMRLRTESSVNLDKGVPAYLSGKSHQIHVAAGIDEDTIKKRERVSRKLEADVQAALKRKADDIYNRHSNTVILEEAMKPIVPIDTKRVCSYELSERRPRSTSSIRTFRDEDIEVDHVYHTSRRSTSLNRFDNEDAYCLDNYVPPSFTGGRARSDHSLDYVSGRGHISVSNASYSPDEVEVIVLPSGHKAVQYSKKAQYGHGDVSDQNSAIKKVMEKTQFMEKSMTTLEDFVRLNRRDFPEDTRIYQRIKFFLLDEQQLREIGENPDAEVYGVKITERLVVPEGAEVAHILQRCYNKNDVQIEYGTNTKDIGGRRYSVTDDLETSYRHLKSPLKSKLPRGEDINLARRRKPYEQLADYHIDYEEKDRKRKLISEPYSRSLYTTAGLGYDDIFTPRKGTSYASSVTSEDSGRSVGSSRRKKRFDSAPQFTSKLRPKKCPLGATVRFNASISGLPMPDVQWFRGSRQINEGGRFKITNNYGLVSLEINEVEKDDAGMYTVKATNLEGECACSASLDVNEDDDISPAKPEGIQRPWFTMEMMNAWAEVGNKATLEVQATGRPLPTFKWQKDSFNLSETDSRYKYFADERGNAKLVIWDVKESDTGLYFCIADNKAGKAKCTASLKVVPQGQLSDERRRSRSRETTPVGNRRPGWSRETTPVLDLGPAPEKGTRPYFIQRPPNELLVRQGETMTLKCVVDGDPKPYVTWMKGVRELSYTEHMRVINDGNVYTLQIKSTLETDMGEYIAVAFNPLGKARSSCYVNIKPRLPDDSDDWELRTYIIDVPDISVETTSTTEQSNVAPSFTKKLPLETYLDEHENLEIKCKTKEAAPEVHVNKDYKFKVTGDLSLEEKTIRIHREEGEETATVVGTKVEVLMAGDKPEDKQASAEEPKPDKPVDVTPEPAEKITTEGPDATLAAEKPNKSAEVQEPVTPVADTEIKEPTVKVEKPVDEPDAKKESPTEAEEPVKEVPSKDEPTKVEPEKLVETEKPVEVAPKEPSPAPTEESSAPTEASTAPTEASTAPTEASSAPTEESTAKTEASSAPSEESTVKTEASSETEASRFSVPTESSAETETASAEEVAPVQKPVEKTPEEPSPAPKEPSPTPKAPSPAPKEPSPAPKEPSPAPTEESSAPSESSSAVTEDSSAQSEEPEKSKESPVQTESAPALVEEKEAPSAPVEETVTPVDAAPAAQAPEVETVPESTPVEEAPVKSDDSPVDESPVKEDATPVEESPVEKSSDEPKPVDVVPTEAPVEEEPKPEKKKKRSSIKPEDVAAVEVPAAEVPAAEPAEPTDAEPKKEKKKKKSIKPDDTAANELPDTPEEAKPEKKKKRSSIKPDDVAEVAAAEVTEEPKSEKKKKRSSIKPDDVAAVAADEVAEEPKGEKKKKRSSIKPDDVSAIAIENGEPEEPKKEKKKKKSIKPDDDAANELPNGEAAPEEDAKKEKKKKKSIKPDDEAANELPVAEDEEPKKEKKKKRSSSIKSEDIEVVQNGEAAEDEPKKEKKSKKRASIKPDEAAIMEEVASDTSSKKEKKKKKKGPPSFDSELQDVVTKEGENVKFTLIIASRPELDSVKWYKDGKKIKKDDHFVIVKDDPSFSLEVIGITQDDIAIYSCTASNEEGSSTTTASIKFQEISVKETPQMPVEDSVVEESVEKVECATVAKSRVLKDDDAGSEGTITESEKAIVSNGVGGKVESSKVAVDENVSLSLEASVENAMVEKTINESSEVTVNKSDKVENKSKKTESVSESATETGSESGSSSSSSGSGSGSGASSVVDVKAKIDENSDIDAKTKVTDWKIEPSNDIRDDIEYTKDGEIHTTITKEIILLSADEKAKIAEEEVTVDETSDTEDLPDGGQIRTVVRKKTTKRPDGSCSIETNKQRFVKCIVLEGDATDIHNFDLSFLGDMGKVLVRNVENEDDGVSQSIVTRKVIDVGGSNKADILQRSISGEEKVSVETTTKTEDLPDGGTMTTVTDIKTITFPDGSKCVETHIKRYIKRLIIVDGGSSGKIQMIQGEAPVNDGDEVEVETTSDTEENEDGDIIRTVVEKKTITSPSGDVRVQTSTNRYVTRKTVGECVEIGPDDKVDIDTASTTEENEDGDIIRTVVETKTITSPNGDIRVQTATQRFVTKKATAGDMALAGAISTSDEVTVDVSSDTEETEEGTVRTVTEKKTIKSPDGSMRVETSKQRYVTKTKTIEGEISSQEDAEKMLASAGAIDGEVSVEVESDTEVNGDETIRTVTEKRTIKGTDGSVRVETSKKRFVTKGVVNGESKKKAELSGSESGSDSESESGSSDSESSSESSGSEEE